MQVDDLVRSSYVPSTDENPRESQLLLVEERLELLEKPGVHGEISLIHGDAEALEDGPDGAAVLEGLANDAKAGEVDDDAVGLVQPGEEGAPGTKGGGGYPDTVEDGRGFRGVLVALLVVMIL